MVSVLELGLRRLYAPPAAPDRSSPPDVPHDAPPPPDDDAWRFAAFELQPRRRQLLHGGQPLRVGGRAFDLLLLLVRRHGEVLGKDELIAAVWPGTTVEEGNLRMHVAALRRLLGAVDESQDYIRNVPLRGYCFVAPVQRGGPPASASAAPLPTAALPALLTQAIGREALLARLAELLATGRCITLVGPAGIGKTLLALTAAHAARPGLGGAAWFVDLGPLAEPQHVPAALATLLGAPTMARDPFADIAAALSRQPSALVVFDNCEHVIEAVARLAERLLAAVPGLTVLCTSREPLRIAAERLQRVGPLAQPVDEPVDGAAAALAFPAVALLVERASAAAGGFVLQDDDVPAALQLCRRLDGLPLAIELAATRLAQFGLRELAERLDDHLALQTPGRRTALPRQRTLHAALDWSHGLLSAAQAALLQRLSVFRGRFTLGDAQAVGAGEGDAARTAVVEALAGLVAKSLVERSGAEALPYRLLNTTRGHAAERLQRSGEAPAVVRRHALRLCEVLAEAESQLDALSMADWRARHAGRIDDVRAAIDACLGAHADAALAAELVAAAAPLWFHLGQVRECLERLAQLEPHAAGLPDDPVRTMRLALAAGHAWLLVEGAAERSAAALSRSLELAVDVGRPHDRLRALWGLFIDRMMRGDHHGVRAFGERFRAACDGLDDPQAALTAERMMAVALHLTGEHAAARAHAERALQAGPASIRFLYGSAYHVDHESSTLAPLARVVWLQGHADDAAELVQIAVARAERLDHGLSLSYVLAIAALPIALWRGDLEAAEAYQQQLAHCTHRHALVFWQGWSAAYAQAVAWRRAGGGAAGGAAGGVPDWLADAARLPGRADMLATFDEALVTPLALARAEQGHNPWCAAEVQRAGAMRAWRTRAADAASARRLVDAARTLALAQGAKAWARRCDASLAELG
ncbi:winged helix-turn-helix domain-containing protein [Aquincola sp. MAHUQ-54]|uniref:Winged helix-turn-helix domain-containing protein n=1 Tax=Aquincola agrisoli TaxID=3119538 RepID=A0AAW9QBA8_9BURK